MWVLKLISLEVYKILLLNVGISISDRTTFAWYFYVWLLDKYMCDETEKINFLKKLQEFVKKNKNKNYFNLVKVYLVVFTWVKVGLGKQSSGCQECMFTCLHNTI